MFKKVSVLLVALLVFTGLHSPVFAEDHGEPPVKDLEQQFNQLIELETNENGEVEKYDSMDRLEEEFKSIMVWPLADYYLNQYFYEENGNLYKEEMDGPVRLMMDQDYTLEKINENHYKLTQQGNNELRGDYTLTIHYSYEAGKWVFSDRMNHVSSENGGEMPDTATSMPVLMASGGIIMAIGALFLLARRRTTV